MPTLDWLHRDAAFRTADAVPYRLIEAVSTHGDGDPGKLLLQGDNLEALKALLPFHRGQVKCIFIDPPYNTQSAFEHYDDNHAVKHCLPRLQKVIDGEGGGISAAVDWQGGGGFRFCRLGEAIFGADGQINPRVRFAALAAFVWQQATRSAYAGALPGALPGTPRLGVHEGQAVYLLYNGILGDRRPAGGNVLTLSVLQALKASCWHEGPKTIYGEACRLGPARLAAEGIVFRQVPYELGAR